MNAAGTVLLEHNDDVEDAPGTETDGKPYRWMVALVGYRETGSKDHFEPIVQAMQQPHAMRLSAYIRKENCRVVSIKNDRPAKR